MYNPNLHINLLSGKLEKLSVNSVGSKGRLIVYDKEWNFLFYAARKNDLYFLKPFSYKTKCEIESISADIPANQTEKVNLNELRH